ncbi:MAG: sugar ABC transporter substrate-binding protein [Bacteroidales bacterium]|jgi:multiple sugar transport system substrate-binding protein|nr:sugar ABC transporter substrate-binding protein [Bacteroidales bacterium]
MNRLIKVVGVIFVFLMLCFPLCAQGTNEVAENGNTVIHVAHFYDPTDENGYNWFNKAKEEFEAENPGIKVEFEQFKWDEIDIKLMSDFRSNILTHDVALSTPQLLPQHAAVGTFEDLNPYLKKYWTQDEAAALSWASTYRQGEQGGKQIGLPLGSHSRICAYNKDMFKAAGLDPENPPKTLDELVDYAKKLTIDKNGDGVIDQWGLALTLGPDRATIEVTYAPLVWGFGGSLYDKTTGKAVFASEAGIKSAEFLWDLLNTYKVVNPASLVNDYNRNVHDSILEEKSAIAFGWGSYWVDGLEAKGFVKGILPATPQGEMVKVGVFPYPTGVVGEEGSGFTNSWDVSMYAKSQHKEEAWKFIDFLLTKADLASYGDAGLPIRKSEWDKPEYQVPYFKEYHKAITVGKPMPESPHYGELADIVASALQRCMNGPRKDIPKILENAQKEYNTKY